MLSAITLTAEMFVVLNIRIGTSFDSRSRRSTSIPSRVGFLNVLESEKLMSSHNKVRRHRVGEF